MDDHFELLEEIVDYNRGLLEQADGEFDEVINKMITFRFEGYDIWNPLTDESSRFAVDPFKKYGDKNIEKMINEYRNLD
ncbi:hypothetical protein [Halanaerobium hydrogeniformans]|uniref:Uncharacterized protein n=1 Tax=Halanaerobium hydrogeniformans TaxID=656519 RepID=E4RNN3_HALHG|nr:hypothetical protein [Halanaerobium hydrogeniformans]ADQ13711.1 hypothetical protein Halsa_0227 [Halanaerobium hydrogeniformans]